MRLLKQSKELQKTFDDKVKQKVSTQKEKIKAQFQDNPFSGFIQFGLSVQQSRNEFLGNLGEMSLSTLLNILPTNWIMFNNAIIPHNGNLTEIDTLIIGTKGIFLIEVKTWKGSFSAYQDKWKMRKGRQWIPLEQSPSSQSIYHLNVFSDWLRKQNITVPSNSIYAPVFFTIARWIGVTKCSVPIFSKKIELINFIRECRDCLSLEEVEKIGTAIRDCELSPQKLDKPKPILKKKL